MNNQSIQVSSRNFLYTTTTSSFCATQVIQWFWEVVVNYSQEKRARLLQFATVGLEDGWMKCFGVTVPDGIAYGD